MNLHLFIFIVSGFRCFIESCKRLVPGHVDELKCHFQVVHGLNVNSSSNVLFKCLECNIGYSYFTSLRRHLLAVHKEIQPYGQSRMSSEHAGSSTESDQGILPEEQEVEDIPAPRAKDVKQQRDPINSKNKMLKNARNFITTMRADPSIQEHKIQEVMIAVADIMQLYYQYTTDMFKEFLDAKEIPETDECAVNILNKIAIDQLFEEVHSAEHNLSYLALQAKSTVPVPKEIVLGKRNVTKFVDVQPQWGKKPKRIRNIRIQKDTAHYIPISETLSLIMRSSAAREMIESECKHASYWTGFRDGKQFENNEFLRKYPQAVRLTIHLDDVEYANPLGSRRTKQKMTLISFKVENFHPVKNASPSRLYLTLVVRSSDMKR